MNPGVDLTYIIEPLQRFAVPLASLTVDPNNTRKHDARSIDGVKRSLQKFGQRLPIIVQKQGMLVRVGNGRVTAARQLGWTHIAALVVDESEADSLQYAIADNRTGELSSWDHAALSEQLNALQAALPDFCLVDVGFDDAALANILGALDSAVQEVNATGMLEESGEEEDLGSTAPTEFKAVDEQLKTDHACPKCGYCWSGGA